MSSRYEKDSEYYLVKGWYERNGGICNDKFYGACYHSDSPLTPTRVVLEGADAICASEVATKNADEKGVLSYAMLEGKKKKRKEEDIERDEKKLIDEEPEAPSDLTSKNGSKGKDKDGVGDLKSEGVVSEMNIDGDFGGEGVDIPDDGAMAEVAKNPEKRPPKMRIKTPSKNSSRA